MERLLDILGQECDVDDVARRLYHFACDVRAPVVGALQLACSDESERECVDAFQQQVAEYLLPSLKFGERSVFRIRNLGARYEWGGVGIAEAHYSTEAAKKDFKLLLVKINSHVSVERTADGLRLGSMQRYDSDSDYCGALHALLAGARQPFGDHLREDFALEGYDRLTALLDHDRVDARWRSLLVAVTNARIQARRALIEAQDRRPGSPTIYLVMPCVTLNRKLTDTEIVCGVYRADWRGDQPEIEYQGLGDDPVDYRVVDRHGRLGVQDHRMQTRRAARDHRDLVLEQWRRNVADSAAATPSDADPGQREIAHRELDRLLQEADNRKHHHPDYVRPMLMTAVNALALLDPVTAAIVLFSQGLAGVHHVHRAHHLSKRLADRSEAHRILDDVRHSIASLHPEQARRVIDVLLAEHRR